MTDISKRPGSISFKAVLLFVFSGVYPVLGIEVNSSKVWVTDFSSDLFGTNFLVWAVINTLLAATVISTGFNLSGGRVVGRQIALFLGLTGAARRFLNLLETSRRVNCRSLI